MAVAAKRASRDIVVIGASAGGVQALSALVERLPADLPAAVFVVLHLAAGFPSVLPDVLTRHGPLRAAHPLHGEEIAPGRIYVAPPDNHLLLRPGYVHVVRGPKENGHRPSVDALFRSAAVAYGPRVIAVVLTGYRDCGTAGLMSVKARGGVAIVQDPAGAAAPDMPQSAIEHVTVDHVAPVEEIAGLIERLVREPVAEKPPPSQPVSLAELEGDERGVPVDIVCPQCQGALALAEVGGFQVFRCHVGHAFSLDSLETEQAEEVERALWAAVRSLEESAAITRRARARATGELQRNLAEKEDAQVEQADLIRGILLRGRVSTPQDVTEAGKAGGREGAS